MGIDKDDLFEIVYFFEDPEFKTYEEDYLGTFRGIDILRKFPEVSESKLEEIKMTGKGSVVLNVISGDYIVIYYAGKEGEIPSGPEKISPSDKIGTKKEEEILKQLPPGCGCLLLWLLSTLVIGFILFILGEIGILK